MTNTTLLLENEQSSLTHHPDLIDKKVNPYIVFTNPFQLHFLAVFTEQDAYFFLYFLQFIWIANVLF